MGRATVVIAFIVIVTAATLNPDWFFPNSAKSMSAHAAEGNVPFQIAQSSLSRELQELMGGKEIQPPKKGGGKGSLESELEELQKGAPKPLPTTRAKRKSSGGNCRPTNVAEEIPSKRGDENNRAIWAVWDPVGGATFTYGTLGHEARQDFVAKLAKRECRKRGGQKCFSVGGCIGTRIGIAVSKDRSWAFIGCGRTSSAAKRKAQSKCEAQTGCSCRAEDDISFSYYERFTPLPTKVRPVTEDRLTQACGNHICCRTWYGEEVRAHTKYPNQCGNWNPLYSSLDDWCDAKNQQPDFCR